MELTWDDTGTREYETGVSNGVLYLPSPGGIYDQAFAWNGLTSITESPSGSESTPWFADNIKYLNVLSREDFSATLEAMTAPRAFAVCDGSRAAVPGVYVHQQTRRRFGLAYKTLIANDEESIDFGFKIHLIYNALAAPSERAYATINDTPDHTALSWSISTTEEKVTGFKPTAHLTIDSTETDPDDMQALLNALYGTQGADPYLPMPDEVIAMFSNTVAQVTPQKPAYNSTTHTITIPTQTGVKFRRTDTNAVVANGSNVVLTTGQKLVIKAFPDTGYVFPDNVDDDNEYDY